ncbi:MAG: sigma-54-dependent Fis family transcriptional regulator [Patescibacteria group bacterium]|nr:sigma-54-dependent Fis family transcriptional regulator [Patescibacteria group bacterium]
MEQIQMLGLEEVLTPYELISECRDAGMKKVVKRVDMCTDSNPRSVLITGENGTGKELVARSLHERGGRKEKTLVTLDCANLDEANLRSELFGHEKGSFTGAFDRKIGLLEKADGGTAFLDEIGEIPPDLQPRLLRVLQDGTFRRYGGNMELRTDFHLIAATNRDLPEMVRTGRFREDLFYRIRLIDIRVPPLRERAEDILRLANHFLDRFSKNRKSFSAGAETALKAHSWPGNVRELRSTIERAVLLSNGNDAVSADDLEIGFLGSPSPSSDKAAVPAPPSLTGPSDPELLDLMRRAIVRIKSIHKDGQPSDLAEYAEKALIEAALDYYGGNKLKVAGILGIGRQTLYNKMARYSISG